MASLQEASLQEASLQEAFLQEDSLQEASLQEASSQDSRSQDQLTQIKRKATHSIIHNIYHIIIHSLVTERREGGVVCIISLMIPFRLQVGVDVFPSFLALLPTNKS